MEKSKWISIKEHKPEEERIFHTCVMIDGKPFRHRLALRKGSNYYDEHYQLIDSKEITHYQYAEQEEKVDSAATSL